MKQGGPLPPLTRADDQPTVQVQARLSAALSAIGRVHPSWKHIHRRIRIEIEHLQATLRRRNSMEELVKSLGFESEEEFHHLVSSADLSSPEKIAAFKRWQTEDGSKEGLLKL